MVSDTSSTGKNNITLTVGIRHVRNPLDPRSSARVRAALELGMRPLRTAARIGGYHLRDENCAPYEPDGGILELADPRNPHTWQGQLYALHLGPFFPRIDGVPTIKTGIIQIVADEDSGNGKFLSREEADAWSYVRNGMMVYTCLGDQFDGQLPPDLFQELAGILRACGGFRRRPE